MVALLRNKMRSILTVLGITRSLPQFQQLNNLGDNFVWTARPFCSQTNLHSRISVEIMGIFQNLNDKGLTIVLVTHEHDIAQFAKRVLIFRDGTIRSDTAVLKRPSAAGC
jgi:ABC-type hemin transport system ATPase subunit